MSKPLKLYHELLSEYGQQNWWPAETKYEVVVGALLTQNTNWTNVEKAIKNLGQASVLRPDKILKMPVEKLQELIRPSGFFRQKAKRLKSLTEKYLEIKENTNERMALRKELLSVKGIGEETADSIILYAFEQPIFVIDAYTRRFCREKDLKISGKYDDYRIFFESSLPEDVELYKEYHALIVEWGKRNKKTVNLPSL
jgi:endonuclease-3 related protein